MKAAESRINARRRVEAERLRIGKKIRCGESL